MSDTEKLREAALNVRRNAYCPYSRYPVGAAILDTDGKIHVGCNVENVSIGLSVCAERNAVAAMVASGGLKIAQLAVVNANGGPPCGACLQVIAEFAASREIPVWLWTAASEKAVSVFALRELLVYPFERHDTGTR